METDVLSGLTLVGLRKNYGPVGVLKGIDVSFHAGEVHALLGPNGAGKSTLLGCISGAVTPDAGTIRIGDKDRAALSPGSAIEVGIGMIYQHLEAFGSLNVSENIFLGQEQAATLGGIDRAKQETLTQELLSELGLDISPRALLETLTIGQQQLVTIARALRHRPRILILDEPTSALSEREVDRLLSLLRSLAQKEDMAIIYVTHLLQEVMRVSDRVTVLRDGQILWTKATTSLQFADLVSAIAPTPRSEQERPKRVIREKLLTVNRLSSRRNPNLTMHVSGGEILGLYGLLGSGRTDLLERIAGIRKSVSGEIAIEDRFIRTSSPRTAQDAGIAFVPSDRKAQALFGQMTASENVMLPNYRRVSRWWRRMGVEKSAFSNVATRTGLVPNSPRLLAQSFSGGNGQKLSVGRWLTNLGKTRLLLLDEPTQGVDVGAREELYRLFREYVADPRRAIIFATSDVEEIVRLADRILVLVDGVIFGEVAPDVGEAHLLHLAHGVRPTGPDGLVGSTP